MSLSYSERRMARYNKFRKKSSLNLVSLMDIFTILVFFLLVNSSNSQKLPNSKNIKLPSSIATKAPQETLVISITLKDILVNGIRVMAISKINTSSTEDTYIPELKKELDFHSSKSLVMKITNIERGAAVTIMGDEKIHYGVLRKILATCRQANFTKISFATVQKAKKA